MSERKRLTLVLGSLVVGLTMLFEAVFGGAAFAATAITAKTSGTASKTTVTTTAKKAVKKKVAKKKVYKKKKKKKKKKKYTRKRARVVVSRGSLRPADIEATVRRVGATYWPQKEQQDALVWIYKHECVRPGVISAAGYQGLFQLGNPPKWMVLGDAASETKAGCEYIKRRYKTPLKAKAFWLKKHWY